MMLSYAALENEQLLTYVALSPPAAFLDRESLKVSAEQAQDTLREAELRVGKASTSRDVAARDAEAGREEVTVVHQL